VTIKSPFLTVNEAAIHLNIPHAWVSCMVLSRSIPSFKLGGVWRIHKYQLDSKEDIPMSIKDNTILTINEVAEFLRVSNSTLYALLKSEGFPAFKVMGSWRVHKPKLDKWIQDQIDDNYSNY